MIKLYRARSLLYRSQILQENNQNIRWKALDEIYKIYMLLHRSDLNISENFRQAFSHFFFYFLFFSCGGRSAPKRPRLPGRKGDTEKEGGKRPQRSAAPSAGCGIVVELAVLKFTRVGHK